VVAVRDPSRHFGTLNCRIAKGSFDHLVGGGNWSCSINFTRGALAVMAWVAANKNPERLARGFSFQCRAIPLYRINFVHAAYQ